MSLSRVQDEKEWAVEGANVVVKETGTFVHSRFFLSSLPPAKNGYFLGYLIVAEAVSAVKKTFARILLIIVSYGYGTVM